MPKTTYTATFPSGVTLTRSTKDRTYAAAWRVYETGGREVTSGFSGTMDLARKAAARAAGLSATRHAEVAETTVATADTIKQLERALPWRIARIHTATGKRTGWHTVSANRTARFATQAEAEQVASRLGHGQAYWRYEATDK